MAESIVYWLAHHGHCVRLEGEHLRIVPSLTRATVKERVLANKSAIVAYLQSLPHPPTCAHPFTGLFEQPAELLRRYGCCLACGWSWDLHGQPPELTWQRVADADSVTHITASGILCDEVEAMMTEAVA